MRMNLLLTIDVDNDGTTSGSDRSAPTWDSLPRVAELRDLFRRHAAPVTWFVRADNQLEELFGYPAYLLQTHHQFWRQLRGEGDEIAWHPHLYQRNTEANRYEPDYNDARCARKLRDIHRGLADAGFRFNSVRIGEAFHGNAMMHALDELGLEIDSTAIPGRVRNDAARRMDWGPTPNWPYRPSRNDYRVPDAKSSLWILEVPMTSIPVHAPYDSRPLPRYANLSYHAAIFAAAIDRHVAGIAARSTSEQFLTLIVHPDEIIPRPEPNPLYSYSLRIVEENLVYLCEALSRAGYSIRFLTVQEVRIAAGGVA